MSTRHRQTGYRPGSRGGPTRGEPPKNQEAAVKKVTEENRMPQKVVIGPKASIEKVKDNKKDGALKLK